MYFRNPTLSAVFFAISILIVPSIYGQQTQAGQQAQKSTAFSFDIDDVISGKPKVGFMDYITMMPRMVYWCPMLLSAVLPANRAVIEKYATDIKNTVNGGSNITHKVFEYLKDNGYGDATCYEQEIIERSQKPYPFMPMIEHIEKLKAEGNTVVGATNQDYLQHQAYRKYMKEHYGIDLNKLFDAVVTTRVNHLNAPAGNDLAYRANPEDNIYVTRNPEDYKPNPSYFKAVEQVVKSINPQATEIIHTDDKLENIEGAQKAGLKGIQFKLPAGSIRKSTPQELQNTVKTWETDLGGLGWAAVA